MTKPTPKTRAPAKRDLFSELAEGMQALGEHREGKRSLKTGNRAAPKPMRKPRC